MYYECDSFTTKPISYPYFLTTRHYINFCTHWIITNNSYTPYDMKKNLYHQSNISINRKYYKSCNTYFFRQCSYISLPAIRIYKPFSISLFDMKSATKNCKHYDPLVFGLSNLLYNKNRKSIASPKLSFL